MTTLKEALDAVSNPSVPLRTFRIALAWDQDVYVTAHSFTCDGDVVKFYTYKSEVVDAGAPVLVAYNTRSLRDWLDVQDVTAEMLIGVGSSMRN